MNPKIFSTTLAGDFIKLTDAPTGAATWFPTNRIESLRVHDADVLITIGGGEDAREFIAARLGAPGYAREEALKLMLALSAADEQEKE